MRTADIRQRWLDYFEKNGHTIRPSVPLLSPDPSILFTIAGMVPFIPYIVGTEEAPWPRVASVQKCIRTNDIDEVGKTTRHGTFFQMCGNFSFGDYFKEGASKFAWDLLTTPIDKGGYGLDGDKLWVTVWEHDDEAMDIWKNQIGLDPKHIQKLPREEIFWDTGQPGPAGPCAEIHYDRGPDKGPDGGPLVDTQGDRFLEIWNLVFDQYLRGPGTGKDYELLGELDKKCIDTGLGLERLAFLLQDRDNMYEIDEVFPVIEAIQEMSGKKYTVGATSSNPDDIRMRIVADHVRSALMLINDQVRPGNDGAGYVLRRLIRRVVRSMRLLGVDSAVMSDLLTVSKNAMKASYPELEDNWQTIHTIAVGEEESFRRTLDGGTTILDTAIRQVKGKGNIIPGDKAFELHDTYGFPIELTLEIAHEQGVDVDEDAFRALMNQQKTRAREDALKKKTGHVDTHVYNELMAKLGGPVEFLGYTDYEADARVVAIIVDGKPVQAVDGKQKAEILLDRTPFYAEMGGQLADHGTISNGNARFVVEDVQAPVKGLNMHRGHMEGGQIAVGDRVNAVLDRERREAIAKAHTATHIVHKVLHENLGEQATQAGSENSPNRMRFDFRHGSSIDNDVMEAIEHRANSRTNDDLMVTDSIMDIDKARAMGAMALFGEKYGKEVRVVNIGDGWSLELCAGTHVPSTGHIGRIAILGESSIGSGVRRIDALVADKAYRFQAKEHSLVSQVSTMLGSPVDDIVPRIETMMDRLKHAEKELKKLRSAQALAQAGTLADSAVSLGNVVAVIAKVDVDDADMLRQLAQDVSQRLGQDKGSVVALFAVSKGRPLVIVVANKSAQESSIKAGDVVRIAAKEMGGGGGGRPDIAQGGGKDETLIGQAIEAVKKELS